MSHDVVVGLRWLAGLSLASVLFLLTPQGDAYRWVDMSAVSAAFVVGAAALAVASSMGRPTLAVVAGLGLLLGVLIKFVSLITESAGPIGGNPSTMTLMAGLGMGFLVLGLADRIPRA